jgi:Ca-activated chloride channel family protein
MKRRKHKVLVLGTLLVLFGMVFAAMPINTFAQEIIPPTVTKTVSPEDIYFGTGVKETTVTIEVTGAGGTSSTITPMDVVFAIDSSGSMGWNDPSNLRLSAAKGFVDDMDDVRDQGAVVSWDGGIDFTKWLTHDLYGPLGVKANIDLVDSSGGTNLNAGLGKAIDVLDANTRVESSSEIIVFLTDGQGSYTPSGSPGSPADNAAGKGYIIYSIGLNPGSWDVNLIDMADATGGAYYPAATPENLQAVYDAIFEEITTSTVPHYVDVIEVTESYIIGHNNFNIAPDSTTTNVDGTTTIKWLNVGMYADGDPDLSADEIVTLSFKVRSAIYGTNLDVEVAGEAKVNYYDKDQTVLASVPIPQATIDVHPYVTDLIAGGGNPKSAIDVGEVVVYNDLDYLYVKYKTTGGWSMTETHLHVATSANAIPQKNGNPTPGQFAYSNDHNPAVTEFEYKIPWTWAAGTTLYIAAHAVVQKQVGLDTECTPIYQTETAWADGDDFPGKNWATYFEYEDP